MMRSLTQALAVVCLVVVPGAAAQTDYFQRFKPCEVQRTSVRFVKGQPEQKPPALHVAGGVATTLVFDKVEVDSAKLAGGVEDRFRTLEAGKQVVVIIPKHDLADGEHISLTVTLKDGIAIPFDLVSPLPNRGADGQVDVSLGEEDIQTVKWFLQVARSHNETLEAENLQYRLESQSPAYALATLLALGKAEDTPFVRTSYTVMEEAGVHLAVITLRPERGKADVGKTAVVFEITNKNTKDLWRFEEVRLRSARNGAMKSFAVRAPITMLGAGQTGRVAVVFDSDQFGDEPNTDHLVLELWRDGGIRQAYVELAKADNDARPVSVKAGRSRAK